MSGVRIPSAGSRLDRSLALSFHFNGRSYKGYAGDTLASAVLAAGETVLSRSWKYHRPRSIVSAGIEEPSALVQLERGAHTIPNAKMPEVELYQDLRAESVNPWPSAAQHLFSINRWFTPLFPAGFYYKTFMWPAKAWMWYEEKIRKAGGLGAAPEQEDPDRYVHQNIHCDVLVAGGGVAGLAAALAAGRSGARVILAELGAHLGGCAHRLDGTIDGQSAADWVRSAEAELAQMPEVRIIRRGVVFGYHDHNFLTIRESLTDHLPLKARKGFRERLWRVRAAQVVLATGAHERPMVFGNNDLPGVMLSSALADYAQLYGVRVGKNLVLVTNNDSAYTDALVLKRAGAQVTVVDVRIGKLLPGSRAQLARAGGVEVLRGYVPLHARGTAQVAGIVVCQMNGGQAVGEQRSLPCDAIGMAGGWNPAIHLYSHSGGKARWDDNAVCFVPGQAMPNQFSVGACDAVWSLAQTLVDASLAGAAAATHAGFAATALRFTVQEPQTEATTAFWIAETGEPVSRRAKAFVDYQNDVSAADIELAIREGFESIEHIKRYTALGFGTDQGKLGNINGMALAARAMGKPIEKVGTTTFRPNYLPITFGLFAGLERGELFDPARKTSAHQAHVAAGALFEDVGQWKRPWYFPQGQEDLHRAVTREVLAVRKGVGMLDASTLGKIDIQGPDAAKLLNWVYTNPWLKLEVGKCRYGLMLDENGMVFDDGVTARLAQDHFLMTTTTGGAARVLTWLERWVQTEWPDMQVYMTSVTDHWSTFAVVGPQSRAVVQKVCHDVDLSNEAFPFMGWREGTVAGVEKARIMRISFSGEMSFEVNVPSNTGAHVWKALMEAGSEFNITPYGTEAMHVLRAEKGYIIVGQDTDGSISPYDLGMGGMVSKTKDFLGRRSLSRSDTARTDRKQLVGLLTDADQLVLPEGTQLTEKSHGGTLPVPMLGHVTSSYFSPTLNRSIAMAVVRSGTERMGKKIFAALADGRHVAATVCSPVFYDPEGKNLHA